MKLEKSTIICSTPRCGSTATSKYLALCNSDFLFFNEPHEDEKNLKDFESSLDSPIILKIHARDFNREIYKQSIKNFEVIKVKRRSHIDQIASIYLSTFSGVFMYKTTNDFSEINNLVHLDLDIIKNSCYQYLDAIKLQNLISSKTILYYEDFIFDSYDMGFIKTKLPKNYDILKTSIRQKIEKLKKNKFIDNDFKIILNDLIED